MCAGGLGPASRPLKSDFLCAEPGHHLGTPSNVHGSAARSFEPQSRPLALRISATTRAITCVAS